MFRKVVPTSYGDRHEWNLAYFTSDSSTALISPFLMGLD